MKGLDECRLNRLYLRDAMEVISGKWKLIILQVLDFKPFCFKELARELDISPRMLSKELRDLELSGLISRTVLNTKPISVEYAITEYGKTLNSVRSSIRNWGKEYRAKVVSS